MTDRLMSRRDKPCVLFSKVPVVLVSAEEVLELFSQGEVISVESTIGFLVLDAAEPTTASSKENLRSKSTTRSPRTWAAMTPVIKQTDAKRKRNGI